MSGPLAKGIIIAASVVVAAGIALMENEQVRQWLDIHRRRIAIALYSLGDGINPAESSTRSPEQQAEMADITLQRRHEIVQRNREELLRKAREEGTAVDLDELTALGLLEREAEEEAALVKQRINNVHQRSNSNTSFDDFVGNDGKLKKDLLEQQNIVDVSATATATASASDTGLRQRGSGARGFNLGSAFSNPFADEMEIHDEESMIAPDADELKAARFASESAKVRSMSPRPEEEDIAPREPLSIRDIPVWETEVVENPPSQEFKTEDELNAEIEEAIRRSLEESSSQLIDVSSPETMQPSISGESMASTDSLFSPSSPRPDYAAAQPHFGTPEMEMSPMTVSRTSPLASFYSASGEPSGFSVVDHAGDITPVGSGTMTPTDDDFSTISSVVGDQPEDLTHADVLSEADTNDSYSVLGAHTPGSWSEVDSDSETEAANGESHVIRR